ncbi:unnamed protein product [Heterobilharzia americana]|nr:unnamed protein product [Heterobilharzia americana]
MNLYLVASKALLEKLIRTINQYLFYYNSNYPNRAHILKFELLFGHKMDIIPALTTFTESIYGHVMAESLNKLENTFLSPFNIYTALGMVLSGGENNTKAEMMQVMQLSKDFEHSEVHDGISKLLVYCSKSGQGVEIIFGNRLFMTPSMDVKKEFEQNLEKNYKAQSELVPFETDTENARTRINQWVSEQTKGKIQELLSSGSVTSDTSVVVTSTTYFKGAWKLAFPKINTHDSKFYKLDGSKMKVQLMYNESFFDMVELPHLKSRAVKIPFEDPMFTLLVILPDAKDGLPNLINSLNEGNVLSSVLLSNGFDSIELQLYLPRFKLEKVVLLCISDVLHKAILEVDEEGAVAAAATASTVIAFSACVSLKPVPEFRVDHPFFVSVVWNNIVPIFIGHITAPIDN